MKNKIFISLLSLLFLFGCKTVSIYYISGGKLSTAQKENYTVEYKANFGEGLEAYLYYTDEHKKQIKLEHIRGSWEKTVVLKSGSNVEFEAMATGSSSKGEYKILVDGKVVSEYILSGKRLRFRYAFELP